MLPVNIQFKFAKSILSVNKAAVNLAVLGELGMYPISIQALKSAVEYWLHVINSDNNLLRDAYKSNLQLSDSFVSKIKILLNKLNFSHVWTNQSTFSKRRLVFAVCKKLDENYLNFWRSSIFDDSNSNHGNKLRTYRNLKDKYAVNTYLKLDIDKNIIKIFTKIKISNSKLAIEQGRFHKTPVENRIRPLCKVDVEDEYHFTMICPKLDNYRVTLINELSDIVSSFKHLNNEAKLKKIFTCEEYDIVKIIVMKISEMYNIRFDLIK